MLNSTEECFIDMDDSAYKFRHIYLIFLRLTLARVNTSYNVLIKMLRVDTFLKTGTGPRLV